MSREILLLVDALAHEKSVAVVCEEVVHILQKQKKTAAEKVTYTESFLALVGCERENIIGDVFCKISSVPMLPFDAFKTPGNIILGLAIVSHMMC